MARTLSFSRLTPAQQEFTLEFLRSNGGTRDQGVLLEFLQEFSNRFGRQINSEEAKRILGKAKRIHRSNRLPKRKGSRETLYRNHNGHLGLSAL